LLFNGWENRWFRILYTHEMGGLSGKTRQATSLQRGESGLVICGESTNYTNRARCAGTNKGKFQKMPVLRTALPVQTRPAASPRISSSTELVRRYARETRQAASVQGTRLCWAFSPQKHSINLYTIL
jgi:hypothetical protein